MYPCSNCGQLSREYTKITMLVQHPYPASENEWDEQIILVCNVFKVTYVD